MFFIQVLQVDFLADFQFTQVYTGLLFLPPDVNGNYWDKNLTGYSMKDKPDCDIGASDMRMYLCEPKLESVGFWRSSHCRVVQVLFTIQRL